MNNLYKEMVRKPGDLCFEVSLESDKGLTMTDLSFALKFFVYGHPKNVCIHKDDLKVVEGKYYAVLNEHGFVNGVLFCEAEIVETINGINRIVSVRSNTGYMIGNCCQSSVDTSSCAHGYSLSLYKVEYVPQPIDPNPEEDQLVAEELFGEKLSLPELTADRAIADEHGNRIADTYETRQAVRNHIREVYNEQFNENPPLIMDGYITPQMLSESTKQLLENTGQNITNVPDGEDLTTKNGVLKLSDKPYNPGAYSGLGRIYLRKNLVGGQNLLTQAMVSKANTIYIIQYDYDLNGAEITIPENCVLQFEGGSLNDGKLTYNGTIVTGETRNIYHNLIVKGSVRNSFVFIDVYGYHKNNNIEYNTSAFQNALNYCNYIKLEAKEYIINKTIQLGANQVVEGFKGSIHNGPSTIIKNITPDGGIFHYNSRIQDSGIKGFTIEHVRLIADYPIRFNNIPKDVTVDNDGQVYYMQPVIQYCEFAPLTSGKGIAIEATKMFDGVIRYNYIRSFNIGILLFGSDINDISNNRINRFYDSAITSASSGTFGSQNEIHHNDIIEGRTDDTIAIKTSEKIIRIYDNYLESYVNKGFIDISCDHFDPKIPRNGLVFSVDIQGNRIDGLQNEKCDFLVRIDEKTCTANSVNITEFSSMSKSKVRKRLLIIDNKGKETDGLRASVMGEERRPVYYNLRLQEDKYFSDFKTSNYFNDFKITSLNITTLPNIATQSQSLGYVNLFKNSISLKSHDDYLVMYFSHIMNLKKGVRYGIKINNLRTLENECTVTVATRTPKEATDFKSVVVNSTPKDYIYTTTFFTSDSDLDKGILLRNYNNNDTIIYFDSIELYEYVDDTYYKDKIYLGQVTKISASPLLIADILGVSDQYKSGITINTGILPRYELLNGYSLPGIKVYKLGTDIYIKNQSMAQLIMFVKVQSGKITTEDVSSIPTDATEWKLSKSGEFNEKVSAYFNIGDYYFDTTNNRPIWWTGTKWVDATGTGV